MTDCVTAATIGARLRAFARIVAEPEEALIRLDVAIGDADHGTNMNRGVTAAGGHRDPGATAVSLFFRAALDTGTGLGAAG